MALGQTARGTRARADSDAMRRLRAWTSSGRRTAGTSRSATETSSSSHPTAPGDQTPCPYGVARIAPPRRASRRMPSLRSCSPWCPVAQAGRTATPRCAHECVRWPYVCTRRVRHGDHGQRQASTRWPMGCRAGRRVHVVWGMGSIARCLLDERHLRAALPQPASPGWRSDGEGPCCAISRQPGLTRRAPACSSSPSRRRALRARPRPPAARVASRSGRPRPRAGVGSRCRRPDRPRARPAAANQRRYRVRVYDEWFLGGWKRAAALLDAAANPPLVIQYYRVEETRLKRRAPPGLPGPGGAQPSVRCLARAQVFAKQ